MNEVRKKPSNYTSQVLEHGKIPPNASDLEEAVLGAIMLEDDCYPDVSTILTPESFYKIEHQHVYEAITQLADKESKIDILTVTVKCKTNGTLDLVGGPFFISSLTDRVAGSGHVEDHANIIQSKYLQREQIRFAGEIYHISFEDTTDPLDTNDLIAQGAEELASKMHFNKLDNTGDVADSVLSASKSASERGEVVGIPTGIKLRDEVTQGRQNGELIIKAARPAMGKTAEAMSEALHMALVENKAIMFLTLEMTKEALTRRALSSLTGVDSKRIKKGNLSPEEWNSLYAATETLRNSKLYIVDDCYSLQQIRGVTRKAKQKQGLDGVFVDYLQLIENAMPGRNRENEISGISRGLKMLAKGLNIPVIALSQLSRGVETRGGSKKPMLADLRESGAIEQDADVVEFLYRPEYYGIDDVEGFDTTRNLSFCCIAKNREGETIDIPMHFQHETTKFSNWSYGRDDVDMSKYRSPMEGANNDDDDEDDGPF